MTDVVTIPLSLRQTCRLSGYCANDVLTVQSAGADSAELQRQQEARRRALLKRRTLQQQQQQHLSRLRTPDPVEGRQHVDVQTELYLEELSDRVEEVDVQCQTDAFLDRQPSPMFIPAKSGVDCETQILDGEVHVE